LAELEANLPPDQQARVKTIPLVFDPTTTDMNAFAGCDDNGAAFIAGTEGLLEGADAIAQTKATDEMYGTHTYDAYTAAVIPHLLQPNGGSAMLPAGIIAPQYLLVPQRISRAHEIFDEIVAFTFGHELAHHYRGHTGCATGQAPDHLPSLNEIFGRLGHGFNQVNETDADTYGTFNVLDTGRARQASGFRWSEEGAFLFFDFFSRLERAAGGNPLLGIFRTHPPSSLRYPWVQGAAGVWRLQHPG
jgi:hypothetical protein